MARAAVFGASGAMGRCVVNSLARDDRIGTVVAVVRTEQPAAFWFLEGDPAWAKVEVLVVPDITQTPTIRCDFGFCCIGVYTGVPEAKFREVELGLNTKAAEAMKAGGARRCCYLSGAGVTGKGMLFSRVKGAAEAALRSLQDADLAGLRDASAHRPPASSRMLSMTPPGPKSASGSVP